MNGETQMSFARLKSKEANAERKLEKPSTKKNSKILKILTKEFNFFVDFFSEWFILKI